MKRYPLEAARKVRAHGVEQAETELSARIAELEAAKRSLEARRQESSAHAARVRDERDALARGEEAGGAAADLARGSAFLARRRREEEALARAVRSAEKSVADAQRAVDGARAGLAEAKAEQDVVERHHDRFRDEERADRERRAEAEAEDLVAARRRQE